MPDTPAGNQTKGWLDAFNSGDSAKYKEFLTKNLPSRLQSADREMGFREMTGGFDLRKIEESTPTKIVALIQERLSKCGLCDCSIGQHGSTCCESSGGLHH